MQNIPLSAIPNQQFSIQLDGGFFSLGLFTTRGVMSVSISLNNQVLLMNTRAAAGALIIPSRYEESGNFVFLTSNFELPDYTKFGLSQSLAYATAADLAVLRQAVAPPITADVFNPIADVPLRFSPQGY